MPENKNLLSLAELTASREDWAKDQVKQAREYTGLTEEELASDEFQKVLLEVQADEAFLKERGTTGRLAGATQKLVADMIQGLGGVVDDDENNPVIKAAIDISKREQELQQLEASKDIAGKGSAVYSVPELAAYIAPAWRLGIIGKGGYAVPATSASWGATDYAIAKALNKEDPEAIADALVAAGFGGAFGTLPKVGEFIKRLEDSAQKEINKQGGGGAPEDYGIDLGTGGKVAAQEEAIAKQKDATKLSELKSEIAQDKARDELTRLDNVNDDEIIVKKLMASGMDKEGIKEVLNNPKLKDFYRGEFRDELLQKNPELQTPKAEEYAPESLVDETPLPKDEEAAEKLAMARQAERQERIDMAQATEEEIAARKSYGQRERERIGTPRTGLKSIEDEYGANVQPSESVDIPYEGIVASSSTETKAKKVKVDYSNLSKKEKEWMERFDEDKKNLKAFTRNTLEKRKKLYEKARRQTVLSDLSSEKEIKIESARKTKEAKREKTKRKLEEDFVEVDNLLKEQLKKQREYNKLAKELREEEKASKTYKAQTSRMDKLEKELDDIESMLSDTFSKSKLRDKYIRATKKVEAIKRKMQNEGGNTTSSGWSRFDKNGYEVSSHGDKRFSALYAKLKDGRTIEEAYQLDVKGYRRFGNSWKLGKGKPPLNKNIDTYAEYKKLWEKWADENPDLIKELSIRANGRKLTDKFATTNVSQARALHEILNSRVARIGNNAKLEKQLENANLEARAAKKEYEALTKEDVDSYSYIEETAYMARKEAKDRQARFENQKAGTEKIKQKREKRKQAVERMKKSQTAKQEKKDGLQKQKETTKKEVDYSKLSIADQKWMRKFDEDAKNFKKFPQATLAKRRRLQRELDKPEKPKETTRAREIKQAKEARIGGSEEEAKQAVKDKFKKELDVDAKYKGMTDDELDELDRLHAEDKKLEQKPDLQAESKKLEQKRDAERAARDEEFKKLEKETEEKYQKTIKKLDKTLDDSFSYVEGRDSLKRIVGFTSVVDDGRFYIVDLYGNVYKSKKSFGKITSKEHSDAFDNINSKKRFFEYIDRDGELQDSYIMGLSKDEFILIGNTKKPNKEILKTRLNEDVFENPRKYEAAKRIEIIKERDAEAAETLNSIDKWRETVSNFISDIATSDVYKTFNKIHTLTRNALDKAAKFGKSIEEKLYLETGGKEGIKLREKITRNLLETDFASIAHMTKQDAEAFMRQYADVYRKAKKEIDILAGAMRDNKKLENPNAVTSAYAIMKRHNLDGYEDVIDKLVSIKAMDDEAWKFVEQHRNTNWMKTVINTMKERNALSKHIFEDNPYNYMKGYMSDVYDSPFTYVIDEAGEWVKRIDTEGGVRQGALPIDLQKSKKGTVEFFEKDLSMEGRWEYARMHNLGVILDTAGNPSAYRRILSNGKKAEMRRTRDASRILGMTLENTVRKSNIANKIIPRIIKELEKSTDLVSKEPREGFVSIRGDKDVWNSMPREFRDHFEYINADFYHMMVGNKQKFVMAENYTARLIQVFLSDMTQMFKEKVILGNPTSYVNNFIYNFAIGMQNGINPKQMYRYLKESNKQFAEFNTLTKKLYQMTIDGSQGTEKYKKMMNRLKENDLYKMKDHGLAFSVITDITQTPAFARRTTEKLMKEFMIDMFGKETADKIGTVASEVYLSPHAQSGKFLINQFTKIDLFGRYAIAQDAMAKGMPIDEAVQKANGLFGNLDKVTPIWTQMIQDYGFIPFAGWYFRVAAGTGKNIKDNWKIATMLGLGLYIAQEQSGYRTESWNPVATLAMTPFEMGAMSPYLAPFQTAERIAIPAVYDKLGKAQDEGSPLPLLVSRSF